jgi:hypothetical protein
MQTAVPEPTVPGPPRPRPTLVDWIAAHGALLEEEEKLNVLATRPHMQRDGVVALERQRMRVQVAQDVADAIYDAVMQDLRRS